MPDAFPFEAALDVVPGSRWRRRADLDLLIQVTEGPTRTDPTVHYAIIVGAGGTLRHYRGRCALRLFLKRYELEEGKTNA